MSDHAPTATLPTARALIDDPIGACGGSYTLPRTLTRGFIAALFWIGSAATSDRSARRALGRVGAGAHPG